MDITSDTDDQPNPFDIKYIPSKEKLKEHTLEPQFTNNVTAETEVDITPSIPFHELYRYASASDKWKILLGIGGAIISGLTVPGNTLLFGNLAGAMIGHGVSENSIGNIPNNTVIEEMITQKFLDSIQEFAINNAILGVLMLIFSYLSVTLFNYAAHSQIFRIRSAFFQSVLNQDISWYDFNQSGEFASRMNEDLSKLEEGLGEKVVMFVHFVVAFIGSVVLAFVKGWKLALVCLSSLPITIISIGLVVVITSRLAKREMEAYAQAGSIVEEVISAIRTVIAFGGESKEVERYTSKLSLAKVINIRRSFFSGLGFGLLWFFIYASYALAFWYGVGLILDEKYWPDNEIDYTPAVMITVFFSIMIGSMNLGMASPYVEAFGVARGAGAKVYHVIEQRPVIDPLANTGDRPPAIHGAIRFRNVHFQYPSRPDVKVLQGLNLTIRRGETVALVGPSGCGKSTCIQLMQRFYDPTSGSIEIDDRKAVDLNVNWLRDKIGVVGQEPVLFGTTIYDNIRYGREDVGRDEIEAAAKMANAHRFIDSLPNKYQTLVGERGAQLSGGQKQRIAIARALVRNPEILLLDEATSALDTASEAKVQAALEKASQGRTTIIVAHRLSTIRNADKICVLKDGRIVEEGSHKELIASKGHYYNLASMQAGTVSGDENIATTRSSATQDDATDANELLLDKDTDQDTNANMSEVAICEPVSFYKIMAFNLSEWPQVIVGLLASIVSGFAMPLFAVLFGEIIGVLSSAEDDYIREQANLYSLYFLLGGIILGISMFLQIYAFGVAGEMLTERLRALTFAAILRQEVSWFDDKSNGTGTLCARLSTDAAAVQGAAGQRFGIIVQSVSTFALSIALSVYYEWKLGLVALAFTPFILVATYMQRLVMVQENLGNTKAMENSTKLAVEVVANIRTVVSLGREVMFHKMYTDLLAPSVKTAKRNTHYRGFVYGMARSLMFFAFTACMWYGGYLIVNEGMFYANVFKVSQALIMGTVAIANTLAFTPNFQTGVTAASKIFHLLNRMPKITDPKERSVNALTYQEGADNVRLRQVNFSYPSRPTALVLDKLELAVSQGKSVALVGPSGCGKSTIIQLIERFYDTVHGCVEVEGHDVRSLPTTVLRRKLGIVSQEPSLFDRTIAENIEYGDNSRLVQRLEVIAAAKQANIHNFIIALPMGYETRLGINGTQLSGGQKQRIAIARALVRNPRILLLDEATSALDSQSEKVVQDALDVAKEGRTCMTIAHRLSTVVDVDTIFVVEGGRVIEAGTHKQLIAARQVYHGLYQLQSGRSQ